MLYCLSVNLTTQSNQSIESLKKNLKGVNRLPVKTPSLLIKGNRVTFNCISDLLIYFIFVIEFEYYQKKHYSYFLMFTYDSLKLR